MKTVSTAEVIADIKGQLDQIQVWYAGKPYGFREHASPQQLQQWADREREEEHLLARLETLEGAAR